MKKLFILFILFIFSFSFSYAQDTIACRNGKKITGKVITIGKDKVTYMVLPDSTPKIISVWRLEYIAYPGGTRFNFTEKQKLKVKVSPTSLYFSFNAGFTVPAFSYRDAIVGINFGFRTTFYFNSHVGIAGQAALDFNGTGLNYISNNYWGGFYIFQQYLVGISYRTGGRPSYPFVDFVGLLGICNATNPVSETGGGLNGITTNTPGNGTGYGGYFGLDFTSSEDHLCSLTFGVGSFIGFFSYANYSSSYKDYDVATNTTSNSTTKSTTKMMLALPQLYFALNFRAKKAQH